MNEEQKNIETCFAEDILSEVANVPTDPQFVSLTDEALDPLKQQAAAQAGYDGYEKVVWTHKPYTFTSSVKQMKSNLILLLRRLWRFPFGRGTTASFDTASTAAAGSAAGSASASAAGSSAASAAAPIRSLADMWQHYITRLKGNPEYGIPSRLSSLTDLPDAPALLADRKIGCVPEAPDGISLVHLLNDTSAITELTDDNEGWTLSQQYTIFPNLKDIVLGCQEIANNVYVVQDNPSVTHISLPNLVLLRGGISNNCVNVESISVPNLEEITTQYMTKKAIANSPALTHIEFPKLRKITQQTGLGQSYETNTMFYGCSNLIDADFPVLEELAVFKDYNPRIFAGCGVQIINMPKLTKISNSGSYGNAYMWFSNLPRLWKIVLGKLETCAVGMFDSCPCLIHLEIGGGTNISMNFSAWKPTTALSDNLQQFLSNFKTYIAERLTDNGSGLTLTLSQEVRNAIHAAEATYGIEKIIITQKGWTISPAPN